MQNRDDLKSMAARLRADVLEMIYEVKDGHLGPAYSIAEIVTALYFGGILKVDPENPYSNSRDRFILSKGHACTILYAALARRGFFPVEELMSFRKIDSRLQGHPYMGKPPGNDATTGSLGNGLATAVGIAKGLQLQGSDARVYAVIGDGEINEGIIWESMLMAHHMALANLCVFLDNNKWQSGGSIGQIAGMDKIKEKVESFGWKLISINGHDFKEIFTALEGATSHKDGPTLILAETIKGKGLDFSENDNSWHKRVPTDEQYKSGMAQLAKEYA